MRADQERIKNLLTEAVTLLCRNSLSYKEEVTVEGLIGITLDKKDIFLVSINETLEGNLLLSSGKTLYDMEEFQCLSNFSSSNNNKRKKTSNDSLKVKSSLLACGPKMIESNPEECSNYESNITNTKIKTEIDDTLPEVKVNDCNNVVNDSLNEVNDFNNIDEVNDFSNEVNDYNNKVNDYNNKEDNVKESSNDSFSKHNDIDSIASNLLKNSPVPESSDLECNSPEHSVIHHTSSVSNISGISIKQEIKDDAFVIDSDEDDEDYDTKMMDYRSAMANNFPLGEGQVMYGSNFSDSDVLSNASQFPFDASDEQWQNQFDMSQMQSGSDGVLLNLPSNINLSSQKFAKLSSESPRNCGQNWSLNINASSKHNWQLIKKFASSESAECQVFIVNHVTRNFRKSHTYRSGRYMVQLYRCKFKMKSNWYPCGCMIKLLFPHNSLECLIIHNGVEHVHKRCNYFN